MELLASQDSEREDCWLLTKLKANLQADVWLAMELSVGVVEKSSGRTSMGSLYCSTSQLGFYFTRRGLAFVRGRGLLEGFWGAVIIRSYRLKSGHAK